MGVGIRLGSRGSDPGEIGRQLGSVAAVEVTRSSQILDMWAWETDPTRLADRLNVGCEREKGVKDDSKVVGPRNWKDRAAIY